MRDYCRRGCDLRKVVMKMICRSERRERESERVNEREMRERERETSPAEMSSFASYATLSLNDTGEQQHIGPCTYTTSHMQTS